METMWIHQQYTSEMEVVWMHLHYKLAMEALWIHCNTIWKQNPCGCICDTVTSRGFLCRIGEIVVIDLNSGLILYTSVFVVSDILVKNIYFKAFDTKFRVHMQYISNVALLHLCLHPQLENALFKFIAISILRKALFPSSRQDKIIQQGFSFQKNYKEKVLRYG